MNRRNKINNSAFTLQQFQDITGDNYNSYTPYSFEKMIKDLFRTQSKIYDGALSTKTVNTFYLLLIFAKKTQSQMFDNVLNTSLMMG